LGKKKFSFYQKRETGEGMMNGRVTQREGYGGTDEFTR